MATVSSNPPDQPKPGPVPGQKPQTTGEPGRTTVAQKEPEKAPENRNPKNQQELDDAAVKSAQSPPAPEESKQAQKDAEAKQVLNAAELDEKLDDLAEATKEALTDLASDPSSLIETFVGKLRKNKSVGAAPLRYTSGGSPQEQLDEARAAGKAPVQGGF